MSDKRTEIELTAQSKYDEAAAKLAQIELFYREHRTVENSVAMSRARSVVDLAKCELDAAARGIPWLPKS